MIPSPDEIIQKRCFMMPWLFAIGAILFVAGMIPLISWIIEGISDMDFFDLGYYAERIALSLLLFISGTLAISLRHWLVRIMLPMPNGPICCPNCQYELVQLSRPMCPECGLHLTSSIVELSQQISLSTFRRRRRFPLEATSKILASIGACWFIVLIVLGSAVLLSSFLAADPYESIVGFAIALSGVLGVCISTLALLNTSTKPAAHAVQPSPDGSTTNATATDQLQAHNEQGDTPPPLKVL